MHLKLSRLNGINGINNELHSTDTFVDKSEMPELGQHSSHTP